MREILFRGKTAKGEWVYGVPTKDDFNATYIVEGIFECFEYKCTGAVSFDVDENTIGQYTGLTDKNGTKIFEGDIVKHPIGTFIVKFLNGTFLTSLTETNYLSFLCSIHNRSEVIGNIHDNPELLESEVDTE